MKKFLIVLALASVSLTSMAQEDPTLKYSVATNSFWSNWFLQGNFAYTAFYSNEEKHEGLSKSPLKDFRRGLGFSVAIGKWFTPGIGLRTKFNAMDGKSVLTTNADVNKIKYWNLQEQALLNLSNLLCGYNETRVWNFIPYFGVGIARNCSYNTYELVGSAGILNTFRVSKRVAINLDLGYNLCGDDFEGMEYAWGRNLDAAHDRWFTAEVGLTLNLGTATWNKVPDVDAINAAHAAALADLNAKLRAAQDENARLRDELAKKPKEKVITKSFKDFVTTPVSVFFNLGKINVANLKDLVNVKALAKYAKENNSKMLVTGYADNSTGSAKLNERLSAERANTVKNELIKMGVPEANIQTAHNGGVKILGVDSPVDFDRRATVQILEDESMKTETVTEN